jgi:glutathione-specific gamma-glutamylcyclotransferase
MIRQQRQMTLTAELATLAVAPIPDAGPNPGAVYMSDDDYKVAIGATLAEAPPALWVFAYGSLLWKPAFDPADSQPATVRGWHRSFCFRVARFRGTRDRPGLMMALDRGGQCHGMVLRIQDDSARHVLDGLFRRELVIKPWVNAPRWLTAQTPSGPVRALGFVVNRASPHYAGRLAPAEAAGMIATAAGHWGSCAEYLRETVAHLEALGIHDRNLWRLQALVADRIEARLADEGVRP